MDVDVHNSLINVSVLVKEIGEDLTYPSSLSELANLSRSLHAAAQAVEAYIGIQHARNEREQKPSQELRAL